MESGGESSELLRPGDIAVLVQNSSWQEAREGMLVTIVKTPAEDPNLSCIQTRIFPLGGTDIWCIYPDRLKLFWRPSAPDAL